MNRIEFNIATGEMTEIPLTDEEIAAMQSSLPSVNELTANIDAVAASIYEKWTRFETEYAQRESAARSLASSPESEASIYVTSFAQAAGKSNIEAAQVIIAQADALRSALAQIAAVRMRKYELYSVAEDARLLLADSIIQQMRSIADALA